MKPVATKSSVRMRQTLVRDPSASVTICWPNIMERLQMQCTIKTSIFTILRVAGIQLPPRDNVIQVSPKDNINLK